MIAGKFFVTFSHKILHFSMQSDLKDKTSAVMSLENQVRGNDFLRSAKRACAYSKYVFKNISDTID